MISKSAKLIHSYRQQRKIIHKGARVIHNQIQRKRVQVSKILQSNLTVHIAIAPL
jgi:hypothetical protein